jgi:hypothetical protein
MTTTNTQPSTTKRRRIAVAGTLLTVAAAITLGRPGAPGGPPGGGPGGHLPNGPGPYVAIAFSPDNGSTFTGIRPPTVGPTTNPTISRRWTPQLLTAHDSAATNASPPPGMTPVVPQ